MSNDILDFVVDADEAISLTRRIRNRVINSDREPLTNEELEAMTAQANEHGLGEWLGSKLWKFYSRG